LLISHEAENKLWRISVPSKFVGKSFAEAAAFFRDKYGGLLLAVLKERESIELKDILSEDSTVIDEFIKRKFEESGREFFGARKDISVIINPEDNYELSNLDWLVLISKERPSEARFMERLVGGAS